MRCTIKKNAKKRILLSAAIVAAILILAVGIGSVFVNPLEILRIIGYRLFGIDGADNVSATNTAIIWNVRLPRVLLAFVAGAALSVSGAVMQSVLRNPLASSFTLGVSSGASLGAALVIMLGISFLPVFTMPAVGFAFAMATMVLVIAIASKMDKGSLQNNTIILLGMVASLFVNAITTLLITMNRDSLQRLIFWQLGSFSGQGWLPIAILTPILVLGVLAVVRYHKEMDIMTFGEETAKTIGVNMSRTKWVLLILAASLTGSTIAFVGIIGFVDLIAPHIVRRIFGARHKLLIPLSAIFGGTFMVAADTIARSISPPTEIPIGVITALIGAPFFAFIYLKNRK
ncbi:MAG: iron ABC transporter permease [Defluviitaleaceae bacterium]|nr:iron ABC transporter permease [Defluviitaleaceae bacterium]